MSPRSCGTGPSKEPFLKTLRDTEGRLEDGGWAGEWGWQGWDLRSPCLAGRSNTPGRFPRHWCNLVCGQTGVGSGRLRYVCFPVNREHLKAQIRCVLHTCILGFYRAHLWGPDLCMHGIFFCRIRKGNCSIQFPLDHHEKFQIIQMLYCMEYHRVYRCISIIYCSNIYSVCNLRTIQFKMRSDCIRRTSLITPSFFSS